MMLPPDLIWTQLAWLEEAHSWIRAQLERLGISPTGPIEQPHIRAWSTVLSVPTDAGALYFKANIGVFAHEAALSVALNRWQIGSVPQALAADTERGWMLMADGGVTLRSVLQADGDISHWRRLIPRYAALQIALSDRRDALLDLGLPDRRLATLPTQYSNLLTDRDILRIDLPEGLTGEEYARLQALTPQFTTDCAQLAAYGIPETLQHDDLHDNNILVREERYTFFDWGDSCVSHPFFTLLVTLGSAARTLQREEDDPAILALRDFYLEPWSNFLPGMDLVAAVTLATRIAMICRALTYYRMVSHMEGPLREQYAPYIAAWLQAFLDIDTG